MYLVNLTMTILLEPQINICNVFDKFNEVILLSLQFNTFNELGKFI
jgi:hypothetical protein